MFQEGTGQFKELIRIVIKPRNPICFGEKENSMHIFVVLNGFLALFVSLHLLLETCLQQDTLQTRVKLFRNILSDAKLLFTRASENCDNKTIFTLF